MTMSHPLILVTLSPVPDHGLDKLALALGYADAPVVENGIDGAIATLASCTTPPSYLIVDIAQQGSESLESLDRLAEHCDPSVHVVVIGSVNDVNFYRELKRRGVVEYFARPYNIADIRDALARPAPGHGVVSGSTSRKGVVISFISAASGDGASTVALNTAWMLANEFKLSTVLVDMDYQFGMIAKNLDLQYEFGIRELFEHPDRGVDSTLIDRMLSPYGERLRVIAAPNDLNMLPNVRPDIIRELLVTLQSQFQCVVLDIPHVWTGWTGAALAHSNRICMVAQLWLRSLTHSTRLMRAWSDLGIDRDHVTLVINRSGAKYKEAVSEQDYERLLGKPPEFYVANDIKAIVAAENAAKTIPEISKSPLVEQFKDLAASIVPLVPGANKLVVKPKRGLLSMLGR